MVSGAGTAIHANFESYLGTVTADMLFEILEDGVVVASVNGDDSSANLGLDYTVAGNTRITFRASRSSATFDCIIVTGTIVSGAGRYGSSYSEGHIESPGPVAGNPGLTVLTFELQDLTVNDTIAELALYDRATGTPLNTADLELTVSNLTPDLSAAPVTSPAVGPYTIGDTTVTATLTPTTTTSNNVRVAIRRVALPVPTPTPTPTATPVPTPTPTP